ncbi:MAG TPA: FAD-dependent oxidoreductase [Nitrososphaerales archaeon]|nr:FAD-dependent oxidoreductase [Nitrososphaerales archaeon]
MNYHSSDILIIGGGIAASMAAIEAAKLGARVYLVDKGMLGRSGLSATTGGGVCAAMTPPDDWQIHTADAMKIGTINDPLLTEIMAREAPKRLEEVREFGVRFHTSDHGGVQQIGGPTFTHPRIALAVGGGYAMTEVLRKEALHRGVRVVEDVMVTEIVEIDGKAVGAVGVSKTAGDIYEFHSKAVILAAGGGEGIYRYVSSNYVCTGDSYTLALSTGAKLANMEFQEFGLVPCPGGVITPAAGIGELISNGAVIVSESGDSVSTLYPNKPFIQAMYEEVFVKRSKVFLEALAVEDKKLRNFSSGPLLAAKLREGGVNFWKHPRFEVMPALRKFYGGIVVDEQCRTSVEGLFAAGECTTGSQGARRLEGDGIGGALVFGKRAGRAAVAYVRGLNAPSEHDFSASVQKLKQNLSSAGQGGTNSVTGLKSKLRQVMWDNVGIIRSEEKILPAINDIREMSETLESGKFSHIAKTGEMINLLELKNMLRTAEIVSRTALTRKESRGFHFRSDYPHQDDENWMKWIMITRKKGSNDFNIELAEVPHRSEGYRPTTESSSRPIIADFVSD